MGKKYSTARALATLVLRRDLLLAFRPIGRELRINHDSAVRAYAKISLALDRGEGEGLELLYQACKATSGVEQWKNKNRETAK